MCLFLCFSYKIFFMIMLFYEVCQFMPSKIMMNVHVWLCMVHNRKYKFAFGLFGHVQSQNCIPCNKNRITCNHLNNFSIIILNHNVFFLFFWTINLIPNFSFCGNWSHLNFVFFLLTKRTLFVFLIEIYGYKSMYTI